jgi:N-acetylmuramoyl-L-alanine amidase
MKFPNSNIRTLGCLGISLLAAFVGVGNAQEKPKWGSITDIKVSSLDSVTRVTVTVSGLIDIKSDRVENPPRFFVDFADTVPMLGGNGPRGSMRAIPGAGSLLKQIRVAENQKGVTRLVFDLAVAEVDFRTMVLRDPNRLEVELRPKAPDGKLKNPLAAPILSAVPAYVAEPTVTGKVAPRKFDLVAARQFMLRSSYRMPDPPILMSSFRLPKAEASQMPYRVSGFVFRDFVLKKPPTAISRQAYASPAVAAMRTGAGRQSLTRVLGLKIGKVVIDPGHGGHDAGSTGATGLVEKDVTLDIAKRLAALLETSMGSEVVLTRKDDVYISPEQRTAIANQNHADLFISIHANSSTLRSATGVETYYLNFTSSQEALEVAARENASSQRSVADLGDLIKKIALKDKIDESREFAAKVQQSLYSGSVRAGNRTRDRGVRKAPFIVLIGAEMPCVLTEIGFLSNPKEEALLRKPEYRQKIAEALYRGVSQYTGTLSHFNVAQMGAGEN